MSSRTCRSSAGFTLIETMVALVIVTLGMTAVYMQLSQYAANAIYLRDKTLASWIGSNEVTRLSIQPDWPEIDETEDLIEFADREWNLRIVVTETEVDNLRRADVSVSLADRPDQVIHTVSALIEPPVDPAFGSVSWLSVRQGGTGPVGPGRQPPAEGPGQ